MKRKPLPGIVAVVLGPKDTAAACEAARERVISAAVAYVTALRDWQQGVGYLPVTRQALTRAQQDLKAAVEGMTGGEQCDH